MKTLKKLITMILTLAMIAPMLVTSGAAASRIVLADGIYILFSENGRTCLNVQYAKGDGGEVKIDYATLEYNEIWILTNDLFGNLVIRPYHAQNCYLSGENGFDQPLVIKEGLPDRNGLWKAIAQGDGKYVLKCVGTGYVIDCAYGHIDNIGNPYLTYEQNGFGAAQNIMPLRVSEFTDALTPGRRVTDFDTNSYYKMGLFGDRNMVINSQYGLFSGANLVADFFNNELNEIVKFEHHGNGLYSIRFAGAPELCIAAPNVTLGSQLNLRHFDGSRECLWEIYRHNDGTFSFRNAKTGLFMDDWCCQTSAGTPLIQHSYNRCTAQHFFLDVVELPWQLPLRNAYCTWKSYSNMSWGSRTARSDGREYHLGLDLWGDGGRVYPANVGKVVDLSNHPNGGGANGRYVIIEHTINGRTVYSFYAHLAEVTVSRNQIVTPNTQIGVAGGSGKGYENYYGKHLHFAITDTLKVGGGYAGYSYAFTGNKRTHGGVTFYNPLFVIENGRLP